MTVASLGFQIDSGPLAATSSELDKLTSSAARAEQAATKVSGAGTRMSRGFADLNPALDKIMGSLGRLEGITTRIDARLGAMAQAATRTAKANQVLDQSAIEASAAYKQLEASLNAVHAAQRKSDGAMASSLAMIEKQKDAIARLNAELQKLRTAPSPFPGSASGRPSAANNNGFASANVAAQFQDIAVTSAMGMNPLQIALQQGTQLSSVLSTMGSGRQVVGGLAAAFTSLVSPISLVTIGLTAAAAAAIQYFSTASADAKTVEDLLDKQAAAIARVRDLWGDATEEKNKYGRDSLSSVSFGLDTSIADLVKRLRDSNKPTTFGPGAIGEAITSAVGNNLGAAGMTARQFRETDLFKTLQIDLQALQKNTMEGGRGVLDLVENIERLGQVAPNSGLKQMAREAIEALEPFRALAIALRDAEAERRRLFNDLGPNRMLLSQGTTNRADSGNLALYESQQRIAAERNRQAFDARIYGIGARSPQERAEAARHSEAARYDNSETPAQRRVRIEQAGALALAQAERQLADAQRDRAMDLDKILQDQQTEIQLIGRTGGAAAALRKEYELTAALRLEAARQGIEVDQKELDLIHERTQALGQLIDQYSQSKFNFDMDRQTSDARLSPRDRQITTTLRQYGLPEDLSGPNAQRIGQQLDWQEAKDLARGFGAAFGNELVSGSHDLGKALLKGLQSSLENEANKLWEKFFDSIGNLFADWLTGARGGGSGSGAIGSVAAALGGRVAANSNLPGAVTGAAPVIPVTRAALGDIGTYAKAIQSIESGGNYGALGPLTRSGDRAYGAYQVMGSNIAPWSKETFGRAISAEEFLRNPSMQDQIFQHKFGGYVDRYGPAGAAQAWFGGPGSVGKGGAGADILGTTGSEYVSKFTSNVNKLTEATGSAAAGLDTFGSGVGKLGSTLSGAFPAAPAAGGGGGGLMSLFGGLFGNPLSISPQARLLAPLAGTGVGLFADGTNYAPGGMAIVGERGPELLNLPQGSQVFDTNRTARMLGAGGQQGGGVASVRVFVDEDGNWQAKVESISEGKAQSVSRQNIAGYQKTQERGGFGRDQQTYMKRKG
jgi:hypothetical protein